MEFEYPKNIRFKCERCALCCGDTKEKIRSILLLKIEAECISREIKKSIDDFAIRIKGFEPYVYMMKKTVYGKCIFLKDNVCTIYRVRPIVCIFYPFELKEAKNRKHIFAYTNECRGIGKGCKLEKNYFENLLKKFINLMKKGN